MPHVYFRDVGFVYDGAPSPVLQSINGGFPAGWTGVVGANGSGKTTLLQLAVGTRVPTSGQVRSVPRGLYCAQRTDTPPPRFEALLDAVDPHACTLRGQLGLGATWAGQWEVLSHGERKRAQIATALWRDPGVLAIDEPTNHLDGEACHLLLEALRGFSGVGLIVSHDRELLDALCSQCFFLDAGHGVMRPGGYTEGIAQQTLEREHARAEFAVASKERKRLQREEVRRRDEAARSKRRLSKRGLAVRDSDARAKIDRARLSGKDARAGQTLRQMHTRVERARRVESSIEVTREAALGIWVPGERSRRDVLWSRRAGRLPIGDGRRQIVHPDLLLRPQDRIAFTGPNGTGKTTLLRHLIETLDLEDSRVVYVPQEISADDSARLLEAVKRSSREELGRVMTVVSRLGSDPRRVLDSRQSSPGETRKLLLALGIARTPHLIAMDEPTNHLDLPSIECLEEALRDCPCSLLLISHDERFLESLVQRRWGFESTGETTIPRDTRVHER